MTLLYDPFTGNLQNTEQPLNLAAQTVRFRGKVATPTGVITALVSPTTKESPWSPRIERQSASSMAALAALYVTPCTGIYRGPLYVLPGFGLLPFRAGSREQYRPEPCPTLQDAWSDRDISPMTGRIQHLRRQDTTVFTMQHVNPDTGRKTQTTLYRARLVAAAALGLHPLAPVMAWYLNDPLTHGYGIENVYTPTLAGAYHLQDAAPPPEPHELAYPYTGNRLERPRYVFTPWTHLDDWPWPTPTDTNNFLL